MNTWNNKISILLVGVLCFTFLFTPTNFKANELKDYDSSLISYDPSYSIDKGPYVSGDNVTSNSFISRIYFRLDNGTISGNSTINFKFKYLVEGANFASIRIYGFHLYDENNIRVTPSSLNSTYYGFNAKSPSLIEFYLNNFNLNLGRDINLRYIVVYFEQVVTSSETNFSCEDIILQYYTPDYTEEMVKPTPEDQENVNNSNSEMEENSSQMNSMLNDLDSMVKPDSDDLINNIDTYIPLEDIDVFSAVMSTLFGNEIVISYLMIVLVVALVSFVLFGKKG